MSAALRVWKIPVRVGTMETHISIAERDAAAALERAKRWAYVQPWTLIANDASEVVEHPTLKLHDTPQTSTKSQLGDVELPVGVRRFLGVNTEEPIVVDGDGESLLEEHADPFPDESHVADDRAVVVPLESEPATGR